MGLTSQQLKTIRKLHEVYNGRIAFDFTRAKGDIHIHHPGLKQPPMVITENEFDALKAAGYLVLRDGASFIPKQSDPYILARLRPWCLKLECLMPQKMCQKMLEWLWLRRKDITLTEKADCTDKWVCGNMVLAVVCFVISCALHELRCGGASAFAVLTGFYGLLRIYGIVLYQFNVLIVHPRQAEEPYGVVSHERSLVLALMNYATVVFWFAFAYRNVYDLFGPSSQLDSVSGSLYASVATMSLLGANTLEPKEPLGYSLLITQVVIALFMTLVVLAQAVGAIQRPTIHGE